MSSESQEFSNEERQHGVEHAGLERKESELEATWSPPECPAIDPCRPLAPSTPIVRSKISSGLQAGHAFQINTPLCSLYLENLQSWIEGGKPGAIVYGRPRLGKSCANRWALKNLSRALGCTVPWFEVPVREDVLGSQGAFFYHLLDCVGSYHAKSGTNGEKRTRLTRFLTARARASQLKVAVLLFDEAHLLQDDHYTWLLNIGNELSARDCQLFCLLVGQSELLERKLDLIQNGKEQIVSRFMVGQLEFRGMQSVGELYSCLEAFDATVFPPRQSRRFPEHFIPNLCARGFQLQHMAEGMWECFEQAWGEAKLPSPVEVPMNNLVEAMINVLRRCCNEGEVVIPTKNMLFEAVKDSGYSATVDIRSVVARQAGDSVAEGKERGRE